MKRPKPDMKRFQHMPTVPPVCVMACRRPVLTEKLHGYCTKNCMLRYSK